MKRIVGWLCALASVSLFYSAGNAAAQTSPAQRKALTLPATGTFERGGTFSGTVALNRFEARGNEIVAIAFITGTLARSGGTIGTVVVGEVVIPVRIVGRGVAAASVRGAERYQPLRLVGFTSTAERGRLRPVQAATCPVVDIVLGPFTINVLGIDVAIQPIDLHLSGEESVALGEVVCQVRELIGNVAGLVGVLNNILALLIVLLGGLTGGLGGIAGGV